MSENETGYLRKISIKTVCGKVKKPTEPTWLARVYGVATDIKSGSTAIGDYECLLGQFEAQNIATGTVYSGGQVFLPPPADAIIISQVRAYLNNKETAQPVQFAVEIGVQPDEGTADRPNSYGYQYIARPLIKTAESDMLTQLRADVQKAVAALPAPKKAAK
jgi:hypothetical protein